MKKNIKRLFLTLLFGSVAFSCTPDYVDNGPITPANPNNPNVPGTPTNPSGQSIILNFTQGEFIGTANNSNYFQNGFGGVTKTLMDQDLTYLMVYGNGVNQVNVFILNKNNPSLTDTSSDNSIWIILNNKRYTSTAGNYTISQEQLVSSVEGVDIIKCKFTFNGTFEVTPWDTFDVIETNVKINGTIIF